MDQDSFRKLLTAPSKAPKPPAPINVFKSSSKSKKAGDASKPAFKPRTVKKQSTSDYRDRAAERRLGVAGDYAQVEALAEDFERKNADNEDRNAVEEQRRYLGGDSEHTVLVKGLDFALLEQNKARAVAGSAEDDDSLEQAFLETTVPKKRTREEIVQELKNKRAKAGNVDENVGNGEAGGGAEEKGLEIAKKAGKFKPIGSGSKEGTKKKVKVKKVKKSAKESKIPDESKSPTIDGNANKPAEPSQPAASSSNIKSKPIPEPEPMDEDFDIFADVGEYQGIDLGDDDSDSNSEEGETKLKPPQDDKPTSQDESEDLPQKKWFDLDDEPRAPLPPPPSVPQANSNNSPLRRSHSPSTPTIDHEPTEGRDALEDGEMEEDKPMRLVPLSSSAIPSIKDILAMDDAVKKQDKRKAKKEKKKGGGGSGLTDERKVDRDYQRLKSYTEKKAGGS